MNHSHRWLLLGIIGLLTGCSTDRFSQGWTEPTPENKAYREDRYQYYRDGGLTPEEAAVWAQKDAMNNR